jgi:hypothetical protein
MILNITLSILNHIFTENYGYFKSSNNKYLLNESIQKLCINSFILRIYFHRFKFTIFYNYYRCASAPRKYNFYLRVVKTIFYERAQQWRNATAGGPPSIGHFWPPLLHKNRLNLRLMSTQQQSSLT